MSRFSFINKINEVFRAKRYVGLLSNSLPVETQNWGSNDFLKAHEISLYLNRAINKRAEKVGQTDWYVTNAKGDVLNNEPLLNLLYRPNKLFTGREFWSLWSQYYDLVGETFIWVEHAGEFGSSGKIKGLHMLIPTNVTIVWDKDKPGEIKEYKYKTGRQETTYKADQILYIRRPDPNNPLHGISLIKAGANAVSMETQIAEYHSRVIKNGGKVEGLIKFKTPSLTREQLKELKEGYEKEYAGAKNSGKPMFMGGDAEYIRTGLTPNELSFLEAKKVSLEDICIMTGVPKAILGSFDDIKYDNADASMAIFMQETINPLVDVLKTALDELLFPDGRDLSFVDLTPENTELKIKETEAGIKNYFMTINEARERHGLSTIKGGDEILHPFNLVNLGEEQQTAKALKTKAEAEHPNSDPDMRRTWWKMQIKRMDKREGAFVKILKEYFQAQEKRIIEQLSPEKSHFFRRAGLIDDVMNLTLEAKIGKDLFFPVLVELLKDAGGEAMNYVGSDYQFNITAEVSGWLEKKTEVFLDRINKTTFDTLKDQFTQSLDNGESRDKLVNRVRETYKDVSQGRAAVIARTEVHGVTQYGTMEGYKQAGVQKKIWVAVMDASTRDTHAQLDGEERPIGTPFSNGLMFPGDPNGPAGEVINCRCVV